jgi:DNA-directed RNA polymerase subunit beta
MATKPQQPSRASSKRRIRKIFGDIHEVVQMPNLIEVQRESYEQFLRSDPATAMSRAWKDAAQRVPDPRLCGHQRAGLRSLRTGRAQVRHHRMPSARDHLFGPDEGHAAPDRVRGGRRDRDRSVLDIKEQDVYMGDMP